MTADLRTQLADEAARHHALIGVDERTVMCTCGGWSSTTEANLREPFGLYGQHVADDLLPLLAAARAEGAAEALRDVADTPRASPDDPAWQAEADLYFDSLLRLLARQYEDRPKETPHA